jgi:hypothetical protein
LVVKSVNTESVPQLNERDSALSQFER